MTSVESLIIEIEQSLKQYKTAGLIDRASLYKWAYMALKRFGQSICERQEELVHVKNGQAVLSPNFHSLHYAFKCSAMGYHASEEDLPIIQNTLMWKERIERSSEWNSCEPCCKMESEKVITENIYFNGRLLACYYDNPVQLSLAKHCKKDFLANDCRNHIIPNCPYEISISGHTLYTNFPEGTIYMIYYGIPQDENGLPLIPDTPRGHLETYLEYHLKMKLYEEIFANGDDANILNQLRYFADKDAEWFAKAKGDSKVLTPRAYSKLAQANRLDMLRHEYIIPQKYR